MKRLIFMFMIFVLVFSVLTVNSVLVFAEGEGDELTGTEETVPEGDGTEGEQQQPENNEGSESEELSTEEELAVLFDELFIVVDDLVEFIQNDETYSTIFGAILAVLAIIIIPFLVGILVIAYIAIAAVVIITSALMSLLEVIVGKFVTTLLIW